MTFPNEDNEIAKNINILPDELLMYIFKFLPLETILSCENVCQHWRKLALDPAIWRRITLIYSGKAGQSEVSEKNLKIISSHKEYIYCIKIQYVYNYSLIQTVIEQCKNLISIELVMCKISKEFEDDISKLPKLRKINLKNSILLVGNVELLIQYNKYKELNYLALSDFGLSPMNCKTLLCCNHLRHIYIEKIRHLELEFMRDLVISQMQILETLHIYGGNSIDDSLLKLISKCSKLKDLAIIRCESLTDEGLLSLTSLTNLDHVRIWNNTIFSEFALLKTLGSPTMIKLKSLSLTRIQNITPTVVDLISEYYKKLKYLVLHQCPRIIDTDYKKQLKSKCRNIEVVLF